MTDKQKINMLTAALIYNTVILNVVIFYLKKDNKFLAEKHNELWDALGVALETADVHDERLVEWATKVEFDLMTDRDEQLKSLKRKGWWRR